MGNLALSSLDFPYSRSLVSLECLSPMALPSRTKPAHAADHDDLPRENRKDDASLEPEAITHRFVEGPGEAQWPIQMAACFPVDGPTGQIGGDEVARIAQTLGDEHRSVFWDALPRFPVVYRLVRAQRVICLHVPRPGGSHRRR